MKTKITLLAVALCAVAAAIPGTRVEWTFHGQPILQHRADGETLELGLREDGVVIWRKITSATNSPAEWWYKLDTNYIWLGPALTNNWITNDWWTVPTNHIYWVPLNTGTNYLESY